MKNKIIVSNFVLLWIIYSCSKANSVKGLLTSFVDQNISIADISKDGSFSVDIPLRTRSGKDFVIEDNNDGGGELRLKRLEIISEQSSGVTINKSQNKKPIFHFRSGEKGNYAALFGKSLLITRKVGDSNTYRFDIKLKKGVLNKGEVLGFSFSVKRNASSSIVILRKEITVQGRISNSDLAKKVATVEKNYTYERMRESAVV